MTKKIRKTDKPEPDSPLKQKLFGDSDDSRIPKDPGNRKRLAAGIAMKIHQQKTLRSEDISVQRRVPQFAASPGVIIADNDDFNHGTVINSDGKDPIILVDSDLTDGSKGVDLDIGDLPIFRP